MGRKLIAWVIFSMVLTHVLNDVNVQAPVPGTVKFQARARTNSYTSYIDFVLASAPGPLIGLSLRILPLSNAAYIFENIPYSGKIGPFFGKNQFQYFVSG